jgi:hypothetical protein
VQSYQLQFTLGFDFDQSEMGEYGTGSVPTNILIKLKTMTIVDIGNDFDPDAITQIAAGF